MKLNVVETLKGKLVLSFLPGSYIAGNVIEVTIDQFEFPETQGLISSGLLLLDKSEQSKSSKKKLAESMVEFSNESRGILVLPWGTVVRPSQRFLTTKKQAESLEIVQYIKSGKVLPIDDAKNKKIESKSKTIKKIVDDKVYVVNPNEDKMDNKAVPKGSYVHNPNKGKRASAVEEQISEIDKNSDGGLEFVDQKQAKERLLQMQKSINSRKGIND